MPTMILTVDGQPGIGGTGWTANTGSKAHAVDSDNGDTAYIEAGTDLEVCEFTLTNPSVVSGAIDSITSVQLITAGRFPARGSGGADVTFNYLNAPGTGLTEVITYPNSAIHASRDGTVQTVNTAGSAWTYTNLQNVVIQNIKRGASSPDVRVGFISLLVTYVAVAADNAVFFGTNF